MMIVAIVSISYQVEHVLLKAQIDSWSIVNFFLWFPAQAYM